MKWLITGMALALAALAQAPADAQIDREGGPIEVTANSLEALTNEGRYIYTQNVDAVQGDARLKSDKLTVVCDKTPAAPKANGEDRAAQGCGEVRTLIAEGNVSYLTPDGRVIGDRAEYDYANKVITITGKVILSRDDGVIQGRKLIYEVDAGKATMTSDGGRVFSTFTPPPEKDKPAAATPGSTPGAASSPAPTPSAAPPARPSASH